MTHTHYMHTIQLHYELLPSPNLLVTTYVIDHVEIVSGTQAPKLKKLEIKTYAMGLQCHINNVSNMSSKIK